jgi:predicted transcriptional regulator
MKQKQAYRKETIALLRICKRNVHKGGKETIRQHLPFDIGDDDDSNAGDDDTDDNIDDDVFMTILLMILMMIIVTNLKLMIIILLWMLMRIKRFRRD